MTDDVDARVDRHLAAAGRRRTGTIDEVRRGPWGTVWTTPTDRGRVWVKRPGPEVRFEVDLLPVLARLDVPLAPDVLGAGDGLVVLADGGRPFLEVHPGAAVVGPLTAALVELAAVQRATVPLVPDLLRLGLADLRPAALPARFDELVDALGPVAPEVAGARPALVDACAELTASAVPMALDHNDVHRGNLLADGGGRTTLVNWGDSVVAHPFATLLVPARVLATAVGADVEAPWDVPVVATARRAYLAAFADLAPGEDLERTARLAVVAAHVARAWVWQRAVTAAAGSTTGGDVDAAAFTAGPQDWLVRAGKALARGQ